MGLTDELFLPQIDEIVKAYVKKWGIEKVIELTGERPQEQIAEKEVVKLRKQLQKLRDQVEGALDQTGDMLGD